MRKTPSPDLPGRLTLVLALLGAYPAHASSATTVAVSARGFDNEIVKAVWQL